MNFLVLKSYQADPVIWMKEATKTDGTDYWEYVILYMYDCLVVSNHVEKTLREEIGNYFKLKENSIGTPNVYLGGNMRRVKI